MLFYKKCVLCCLSLALFLTPNSLLADIHLRPDGHAPIPVMGDHTHHTGEWMASYRYMYMEMEGNRDGHDRVSTEEVLQQFMVAPKEMTMQMHMIGLMYGVNEQVTVAGMIPFLQSEMSHVNRMGRKFRTRAEGLSDLKASALIRLNENIHLNTGVSFPTGEVDVKDNTLGTAKVKLPYPMQLGSGTWDLLPGITYNDKNEEWSWGGQARSTLRLGRNNEGYSLGNRYGLTSWVAKKVTEGLSASIRLDYSIWEDIDGSDDELNPRMVPTADPDLRGGKRLDLGLGLNSIIQEGAWKGHRFAVEFQLPLAQSLKGPQLETDWSFTVGWQFAW